jgi:hypothetical protein
MTPFRRRLQIKPRPASAFQGDSVLPLAAAPGARAPDIRTGVRAAQAPEFGGPPCPKNRERSRSRGIDPGRNTFPAKGSTRPLPAS